MSLSLSVSASTSVYPCLCLCKHSASLIRERIVSKTNKDPKMNYNVCLCLPVFVSFSVPLHFRVFVSVCVRTCVLSVSLFPVCVFVSLPVSASMYVSVSVVLSMSVCQCPCYCKHSAPLIRERIVSKTNKNPKMNYNVCFCLPVFVSFSVPLHFRVFVSVCVRTCVLSVSLFPVCVFVSLPVSASMYVSVVFSMSVRLCLCFCKHSAPLIRETIVSKTNKDPKMKYILYVF